MVIGSKLAAFIISGCVWLADGGVGALSRRACIGARECVRRAAATACRISLLLFEGRNFSRRLVYPTIPCQAFPSDSCTNVTQLHRAPELCACFTSCGSRSYFPSWKGVGNPVDDPNEAFL